MLVYWAKKINNTEKNTEALLAASREICIEVSAEKMKFVVTTHHQNIGQKHYLKISKKKLLEAG